MGAFKVGDRVRFKEGWATARDRVSIVRVPEWDAEGAGKVGTVTAVREDLPNNPPGSYYAVKWDNPAGWEAAQAFQIDETLESA